MKKWIGLFSNNYPLVIFIGIVCLFFYPFFLHGKIPIPADTIVGMYHPWRDVIWGNLQAGVPYKNFLITDPVRQQYVWRKLAIDQIRSGNFPSWNPYSFSGTPLAANFQTGAYYPLNIIFFILPFNLAWGSLVLLQSFLAGLFLYLYLRYIKISKLAGLVSALSFSFSGFVIAWLEWNTIMHVVLWLPLILLAKEHLLNKLSFVWILIFIFAEVSQIFAGHIQFLFYCMVVSNIYLFVRITQISIANREISKFISFFIKKYAPFILIGAVVLFITAIQWFPTLKLISYSARNIDQGSWLKAGWFIPWQHLIQFIAPDFFGNPATGNYFGVWNYGEFIGYIGIIPLIFALYALVFRFDKKVMFFGTCLFTGFLFSLPTPLAKLPYLLGIPLLSSSQPTRLIFIIDFALCILAALGFDQLLKNKSLKKILFIVSPLGLLLILVWLLVINPSMFDLSMSSINSAVSRKNLILPSLILITSSLLLIAFISIKKGILKSFLVACLLFIVIFDLLRFSWKFIPFTKAEWIFPDTHLIKTLVDIKDNWRVLSLDRRVFPPNFSAYYQIQDVSGYDPLYLSVYNQLAASWERNTPDITPASFNRIVTPQNYESFITDLLGIKYVLSYGPVNSQKLILITSEGMTNLYENKKVFPRAFLAEQVINTENEQKSIDAMYNLQDKLRYIAVIQDKTKFIYNKLSTGEYAKVMSYNENNIKIDVKTNVTRLLVLTDTFYPSWEVFVDGRKSRIIRTDFAFRGVEVLSGNHFVEFKNKLL